MTLGRHQEAFGRDLVALLNYALSKGYQFRIAEVQRTLEQQQLYVKTGKSKTLDSMHIKKCAADIYFTKDGQLVYPEELGRYWESLSRENQAGMFWKTFKDQPHYQRTV
jgi:peptidoglycan L-alanyl-D-glutamate endopeptidase CwlK